MPITMIPSGLRWRHIEHCELSDAQAFAVERHLGTVLRSWESTRYGAGLCRKGVGVDCVRFVVAVYDEVRGLERTETPRLPQDAAMHSRASAMEAMRLILDLCAPHHRVDDGTVEPGDALVTGSAGGGPGHAIIVGSAPNTMWQATIAGVHWTGISFQRDLQRLYRVYRPLDKYRWGRSY